MIGFWVYVAVIVPGIVIVLTIVMVRKSRSDGARIDAMKREAHELRMQAFLIPGILRTSGQARGRMGNDGPDEAGSEAYQRAAARSQATY